MNASGSYHDRRLADEIRGILIQNFDVLKVTPREAIADQLRGRRKHQYEDFIEEIEGVRLSLNDEQLLAWWFEYADYWPPDISLRGELENAVEVARQHLASCSG
ncbi:MAG: hypothetical protein K2P70_11935 [Hyphomonadaceae bacterium]|nr:hypothetical protein [Hyphomonadaceae bacterium]